MKKLALLFILCISFYGIAQDKQSYQLFDKNGKKTTYKKLLTSSLKNDVVLFGEYHNNSIVHWLQLELTKDLAEEKDLVLGAEMLEADNQKQVNQYLKGEINQKQLMDTTKLWSNFETDYLPMLDYAKENSIPWIATNTVRKYASLVYKKGRLALDSLSDEEKRLFAPADFPVDLTLSQYDNLLKEFAHAGENFVYAQAIKDATMGESIVKSLNENSVFYHINGSYHSDFKQGIMWYVNYYGKFEYDEMISISTVNQTSLKKLDKASRGKADFIICTPETMTKTH